MLEELLPEREFLGPLFEEKIETLRLEIEAICDELRNSLIRITETFPNTLHGMALHRMDETLRADISEMSKAAKVLQDEANSILALRQQLGALAEPSPENKDLLEVSLKSENEVRESARKMTIEIQCYRSIQLALAVSAFNVVCLDTLTVYAKLEQIHLLLRFLNRLQTEGATATKNISLTRVLMKNLILSSSERAAEKYGEIIIGNMITTLVPVIGILLHGFREWREGKSKPEESIALVKLLIATREIVSIWENGGLKDALIITQKDDNEFNSRLVDHYGEVVDEIHRYWMKCRSIFFPQTTSC